MKPIPERLAKQGEPSATSDDPHGEQSGTVVGPYKLLEPIGEGGMGSVWMASRPRQ